MTDAPTNTGPNRKLTVTVDEKPVELFMSFGLLDSLLIEFPADGEVTVETAVFNAVARSKVLNMVLTKNGKYGMEGFNVKTSDIDPDEVTKIFNWVVENVTDFFLKAGEGVKVIVEKNSARMTSLVPSANG